MAVTNGLVLAIGSLLIGVPIVLHFLMQPRPKRVEFPAIRFVRAIQRVNQRRLRLRHWLLLALRVLAVALLVLALARPTAASSAFNRWLATGITGSLAVIVALLLVATLVTSGKSNRVLVGFLVAALAGCLVWFALSFAGAVRATPSRVLGNQQAPVAAAILIDVRPTMLYQHSNQTRLDRARELGAWLLDELPADSQLAIVTTDGEPPFFSVDLAAAKKRLETIDVRYTAGSLPQAIPDSLDLLAASPHQRHELYILTDLTSGAWSSENIGDLRSQIVAHENLSIYVIDVGVEDYQDFALALPRLATTAIARHAPLEVETTLSALGTSGSRIVTMYVEQPDATRPVRRDNQTLVPERHWVRTSSGEASPGQPANVKFVLDEPLADGTYHGWIEVQGADGLSVDDRRYFSLTVHPAWQVLVAAPADTPHDNIVETIAPEAAESRGRAEYECTVVEPTSLPLDDLARFDAVFLADPPPLEDSTWMTLARWVEAGGGLMIAVGKNAADANGTGEIFSSPAALNVLPARLSEVWRRPAGDLFLSPESMAHPILAPFRSLAGRVPWHLFPIFRHWGTMPLTDVPPESVAIIATYGNGEPAIIERRLGKGRVLLVTTPLTESMRMEGAPMWNKLFIGDCWPAWLLVRQSARYLVASADESLNLWCGQPAVLPNDPAYQPSEYFLFPPANTEPVRITASNGQLRYRATEVPGQYRLKGDRDGPVLRGFSVNLPAEATSLERIEPERLGAVLGEESFQLARDTTEIRRQQGAERVGQEFLPILLIVLAVIMAMEWMMANRFYAETPHVVTDR